MFNDLIEGELMVRILILVMFLSGCTVMATRNGDMLALKGWGAKSAKWPDGAEINKDEPIQVPDTIPFVK